jgi:hypothetical protein
LTGLAVIARDSLNRSQWQKGAFCLRAEYGKAVGDEELQYLTLAEDPAGKRYGDAADQEVQGCDSVETVVLNIAGTYDGFCTHVRYGKAEDHHRQRNNRLASHYQSPSQKRSIRQTSIVLKPM